MSEYRNTSDADLATTLAAIESLQAAATIADAIRAEQQYRIANAEQIKARAANVATCRAISEGLASVRHNETAAISDPDGTIVKNLRLGLVKTLVKTFDVSVHTAEKIVLVLMDEHQQTDAAGDVEKAAAYVAAHKTSTVYNSTRPDDADKGAHASTDTLNAAIAAGESASKADDGKSGK